MGAYIRFRERRLERRMAQDATRGTIPPHDEGAGTPVTIDGVTDRRQLIPPLGLREYWYPALPVSRVPRKKPLYWRMLGEELCFFRDGKGGVSAVSDVCPHRGASLSQGRCYYEGTVTCPYHAAVFDGSGECKAFLTEGPDSKMPGTLYVQSYPTRTLKGWVFVWMGQADPSPIEEDIPPEFFEPASTMVLSTYTYWPASWIVTLENQNDAHNAFFVHRNSLMNLLTPRGRKRTPIGPSSRPVNDRALVPLMQNQTYYADENGKVPHQMHYSGVGDWPLHQRHRILWWVFRPWYKYVTLSKLRRRRLPDFPFTSPEEWGGTGRCWHLPCAVRANFGAFMYTRNAVPVDGTLSRLVYFHSRRVRNPLTRLVVRAWFRTFLNWFVHYNFSGQDGRAAGPCRYWTPETLAPTDSHLLMLRRLITERSRDVRRRQAITGEALEPGTMMHEERALLRRFQHWGLEHNVTLEQAETNDVDVQARDMIAEIVDGDAQRTPAQTTSGGE